MSAYKANRVGVRPVNIFEDSKKYLDNFEKNGVNSYNDKEKENKDFLEQTKNRMKQRGIMAKLEVMMLDYIFIEDDGKVSFLEKRAIKKHFKSYDRKITPQDIKELQEIENTTLGDISNFISKNSIEKVNINKGIHTLQKITKNKENYSNIIKDIQNRFVYNENIF